MSTIENSALTSHQIETIERTVLIINEKYGIVEYETVQDIISTIGSFIPSVDDIDYVIGLIEQERSQRPVRRAVLYITNILDYKVYQSLLMLGGSKLSVYSYHSIFECKDGICIMLRNRRDAISIAEYLKEKHANMVSTRIVMQDDITGF